MLSPKKTKFRRYHRGKMRGKANRGNSIVYGDFGLQALEPGWLKSRQIESGRRVLTRYVRRNGKLWVCVFPDKPVTMRAAESRMGSGKGIPEYWVAVVKPGKIIYELTGLTEAVARKALRITGHKMPIQTQIVIDKKLK
uniref:Large ribosomal subunit protein uL16c n=2 Tax=Ulotrichales TaxID=31306 RepID=A0A1B2RYM9_9CHLO|nr:ribosomal protein L16 [Rhexinema sarcinoideum]AOC61612.1 ribosomal protein L16 [Gloeotilopsis planctonica]